MDPTKCAECNAPLTHVFAGFPEEEQGPYQRDLALSVLLGGGYGMFYDNLFIKNEHEVEALLCRDCGLKFLELHPWAEKMIGKWLSIGVRKES